MDLKNTLFGLPLKRDLYLSSVPRVKKEPLHILITEAATKIAYCLIYKICKGEIFGDDQEIILHLVNSKGVVDHKSILIELQECGFHLLKDAVVTSNPEECYRSVDIIVILSILEEESGFCFSETVVSYVIKLRQVARNIGQFCKPETKIVIAAPSTKLALLVMMIIHKIEPRIRSENLSTVTLLDEAIAKAQLAERLKTTTDKVKNLVIWGATCPDVHNATVRMYPPGDLGAFQMKDIPIAEALNDDKWLRDEFVQGIYKRVITADILKGGKSLALGIAKHLKALFMGTDEFDEIVSMGVLSPQGNYYAVPQGLGFSYPVNARNGYWNIMENVKYDVRTHLCLIKSINRIEGGKSMTSIHQIINRIIGFEKTYNETIYIGHRQDLLELMDVEDWEMKYFLSPLPEEAIPKHVKEKSKIRKSIMWEDVLTPKKKLQEDHRKSSIRFSFDQGRKKVRNKRSSILKTLSSSERIVLPPISKKDQRKSTINRE